MILLFSDGSLGLASSEGGVGEFGSFLVRAEGMVEGSGSGKGLCVSVSVGAEGASAGDAGSDAGAGAEGSGWQSGAGCGVFTSLQGEHS